jgi:signal transduction histidine kinase
MPRQVEPRARPTRLDIGVALVLAVVIQVEYHTDYSDASAITWRHIAVGLALSAPLAWRRIYPVTIGLGVTAVFCFQPELVKPTPNTFAAAICLVVAVSALALYPRRWVVSFGTGAVAGAMGVVGAYLDPNPKGLEGWSMLIFILGIWFAAALLRQQTERARRSEAAAVFERLSAESRAHELVAAERSRIARELHDVVSHGMGVIVIQARGGRRVLNVDPSGARNALDEIERVSTDCLQEMRLMLDVLRIDGETEHMTVPLQGLARLPELLSDFRAAGLDVDYAISGQVVPLATGLDVSAFRVIQESLTNVLQHAHASSASLRLSYSDNILDIDITNDGPVVPMPTPGHGLVGMTERVDLFDGALTWGPLPEGGFHVHARFPYAVTQ